MSKQIISGPVVLVILDGWGIAPESDSNPIAKTKLPTFDRLFTESKHCRLWAHGEYVGLPKDQDGNSEAGHLNLGAGRIVKQDAVIISEAIADRTFFKNPAFGEAIQHVKRNNSAMHLIGMLSDGQSAHSTPNHLYALLDLMEGSGLRRVFIHLFTDGRDSFPTSGKDMLFELQNRMYKEQKIASITGRFYAMDRKKEWSRTKAVFEAMVLGKGIHAPSAIQVFDESYAADITDEFIKPHVICENDEPIARISDNDSVIFFNHRSDRARQLAKPFVQSDFIGDNGGSFKPVNRPRNLRFVAMTDFGPDLGDILTAFPSIDVKKTLPAALSGKRQLYVAENEKFAHTTYFFNGGYDHVVGGEERIMVLSPQVNNYAETPGMSSEKLTNIVVSGIDKKKYDFITVNFACLDMIAHTGDFVAAQKALQAVDGSLGRIMSSLEKVSGALVVTADHGNIEEMKDLSSGEIDTEHSKNQVFFLLWGRDCSNLQMKSSGILGDVAPTILELMGINKPKEMTGNSLLK